VASAGGNIDGRDLNNPQCMAANPAQEEFLVADALNDRIVIFDTLGTMLHLFPLGGHRRNPFGIAVNKKDEILVGAMDRPELWLFDYSGEYLRSIELPDSVLPGRLHFLSDDTILVVDRAGTGVLLIDDAGNALGSLVSDIPGCKPSAVFFDKDGNRAIVSYGGAAITGFDSDGKIIYSRGEHGRRPEDFSHPTAAVVDNAGWLWIIDSFRHHIKRFDPEGNFVDIFGQRGVSPGEFYFPVDIAMTSSGKLAVLNKGSGRLQIFKLSYDENKR
jgi:DNA-binding beta-propeller fold protein YncE